MSTTGAINELIKQIKKTAAISEKSKDSNEKMEVLRTKLQNMYNDYRAKTEIRPDFNSQMPLKVTSYQFDLKSPSQLETQAAKEISEERKALVEGIDSVINEEESQSKADGLSSYQTLNDGITDLNQVHQKELNDIKSAMTMQGLTQSSIAENMLNSAVSFYSEKHSAIHSQYLTKVSEIQKKTAEAAEWKTSSLLDFDIKAAAKYESRLNALKRQQQATRIEYEKYLEESKIEAELFKKQREAEVAKLNKAWEKSIEAQRKLELETAIETGGYTGELEEEMDARYQIAYETFQSMGSRNAKKYFGDNEAFLKEQLGAYYYKLKKKIDEL